MQRLLLVMRHTESEGNLGDIFTGHLDLPLTDEGRKQARKAAAAVVAAGLHVSCIFTSTLLRARQTAAVAAEVFGLDATHQLATSALDERDYGVLTGISRDAAIQQWGAAQVRAWRRSYDVPPPHGESLHDVVARVGPFFAQAIRPAVLGGEGVLVIGHSNSLRALAMVLRNLSPEQVEQLEILTGAVTRYDFSADGAVRNVTPLPVAR